MTEENELPTLDFTELFNDVKRYARSALIVGTICAVAVIVPILNSVPKYTSSGQVMLDPRSYNENPGEDVVSNLPSDTTQMDTEVEVLKSTAIANQVIANLSLDKDPEFNPFIDKKAQKETGVNLSKIVKSGKDLSLNQERYREQKIVENVLENLSVKRQGLTRAINVSYKSESPDKSARIVNEWLTVYLKQQTEAKIAGTRTANQLVGNRLSELQIQVEEANNALQLYKIQNDLLSSDGKSLAEQEISNYNQQVATSKAALAKAEAKLSTARGQLSRGSAGDDLGEALESPVIQNLRQQRAEVSRDYAQLSSRYGPKHPEIIKSREQLRDLDKQIASEIGRIVSNLSANVAIQRQELGSLTSSLEGAKSKLEKSNLASVRLNELETNADSIKALYESYLNKYKETAASEGNAKPDARVISSANLPTKPSEPKIPLTIALAGIIGLMGAALTIILRRLFDTGINYSDEIETRFKEPLLATIPTVKSTLGTFQSFDGGPVAFLRQKPLSVFAEGFRNLRASLIYSTKGENVKVIAITSPIPADGKTTTTVCLAHIIASSGQSVVVVDCDLRRHAISNAVRDLPQKGLLEFVSGEASIEEVTLTEKNGVSYLPLAKGSFTAKDVFGSENMDIALDKLRANFDVIILDTAPVLPVVETRILARKADATVLLARWRKTPRKAIQGAIDILKDAGVNLSGLTLTQVDLKQAASYGYGKGGYYGYGKAYNGYFVE